MLGLFAATITPFMGHQSGVSAAKYQPAKELRWKQFGKPEKDKASQ